MVVPVVPSASLLCGDSSAPSSVLGCRPSSGRLTQGRTCYGVLLVKLQLFFIPFSRSSCWRASHTRREGTHVSGSCLSLSGLSALGFPWEDKHWGSGREESVVWLYGRHFAGAEFLSLVIGTNSFNRWILISLLKLSWESRELGSGPYSATHLQCHLENISASVGFCFLFYKWG